MSDSNSADPLRRQVARGLWDAGAIRIDLERPFELASGNRSPIYVNCRVLISDPGFMRLFVRAARAVLEVAETSFDAVAGGETAGIPYAAYLAQHLDRPMLYVRKRAKGHGVAAKVEGRLRPGWRVLLVEDLVTDGSSKLGFIEALRADGAEVADALVLFDRQQGADALLSESGVCLHAVTDREIALVIGEGARTLSPEARAEVDHYFGDPAAWHAERGFDYRQA